MRIRWVRSLAPALLLGLGGMLTARSWPAFGDSPGLVAAFLDGPATVSVTYATGPSVMPTFYDFSVTDTVSGNGVAVTSLEPLPGSATTFELGLASNPDVTHRLAISYAGSGALAIVPRLVLNDPEYVYGGKDLGARYGPKATTFRLWAPLATGVSVLIYGNATGSVFADPAMTRGVGGTWFTRVTGNLANMYYVYQVTNFGEERPAMDPYAKNAPANGEIDGADPADQGSISQIVNLAATRPDGWSSDRYRVTPHPTDALVWETSIRDFSIDPNSGMRYRGKYLAFTESGTHTLDGTATGVDSLVRLGITHVDLLPSQRCGAVNEITDGSTVQALPGEARSNWCFDPVQLDVLNGVYATDPNGTVRIREYREMIQALYARGLGVIQDVVDTYMHDPSALDAIVPGFYFRTDASGQTETVNGHPILASERPMVRKLIVDSAVFLMHAYHLDGFRFDLLSLLDARTVLALRQALQAVNRYAVLLGDAQPASSSIPSTTNVTPLHKDTIRVSSYNQRFRNALMGTPGQTGQGDPGGYATGNPADLKSIKLGMAGTVHYSTRLDSQGASPEQSLNGVDDHTGLTLWDRIGSLTDAPNLDESQKIRMAELAEGILLTSQGVPFMEGGDELLRTKGGNADSSNAGDAVNRIDWQRGSQYAQVFAYDAGLLRLRRDHPAFRLFTRRQIVRHLRFLPSPDGSIAYELVNHANHDPWKTIAVLVNPDPHPVTVHLRAGAWQIEVAAGIAAPAGASRSRSVQVAPMSIEILDSP
ncbi:MAG: hypothetical protein ACRDFX_03565 [Chloroflexota bacterium]